MCMCVKYIDTIFYCGISPVILLPWIFTRHNVSFQWFSGVGNLARLHIVWLCTRDLLMILIQNFDLSVNEKLLHYTCCQHADCNVNCNDLIFNDLQQCSVYCLVCVQPLTQRSASAPSHWPPCCCSWALHVSWRDSRLCCSSTRHHPCSPVAPALQWFPGSSEMSIQLVAATRSATGTWKVQLVLTLKERTNSDAV